MAEVKKATAKVISKATPVEAVDKTEAAKVADKTEVVKQTKKVAEKKEAAKKPATKKPVVKKEAVKKEAVKKAAVKETVTLQYEDQNEQKTYTTEDLMGICKDVWKYDLNGKPSDLKSIELYVKPQENRAYYVINGDITGSFGI